MGDKLTIDPDAVDQAASNLEDFVQAVDQAWLDIDSTTANELSGIDIREFDFRLGLNGATAFFAGRINGFTGLVADGAEYLRTAAAEARHADAETEGGLVTLEDAISPDEYTRNDYYEQTGAERPKHSEAPIPVPGGEDVPVA